MNIILMESLSISEQCLKQYSDKLIKEGHNFKTYDRTSDIEKQKEQLKDAEIAIIANMPLCSEVIKSAKNLKFIDIAFTGVDHVDINCAKELKIDISNASGYSNDSVAELTICMILTLLRNVRETEKSCRAFGTKEGLVGNELKGKTVGIIGTGAIGMTVAKILNFMGCKIIAYDGFSNKQSNELITYMPLKEMLENSDIVTLHCPSTKESKHLINKETLSYMKKSTILINTARGAVVDSNALAQALNEGKIRAAAVDVFDKEPPLNNDEPLLSAKNVLLTPHIAFATEESMQKRAKIVFENIDMWLCGKQINKV